MKQGTPQLADKDAAALALDKYLRSSLFELLSALNAASFMAEPDELAATRAAYEAVRNAVSVNKRRAEQAFAQKYGGNLDDDRNAKPDRERAG